MLRHAVMVLVMLGMVGAAIGCGARATRLPDGGADADSDVDADTDADADTDTDTDIHTACTAAGGTCRYQDEIYYGTYYLDFCHTTCWPVEDPVDAPCPEKDGWVDEDCCIPSARTCEDNGGTCAATEEECEWYADMAPAHYAGTCPEERPVCCLEICTAA